MNDTNAGVNVAECFTQLDPKISVTNMLTFLYVARRGVCTQKDIELTLGLSNAAASRNVGYWTERRSYGLEGHGYISREIDPKDNRHRLLSLTKEGQEFYKAIKDGNDAVKRYVKEQAL